jgi:hypothetical protein
VHADQIAPWVKLAGTTGDGRLILDGTASGILRGAKGAALRAEGKLDFQSVHLSNVSVASGHAGYAFENIGQSGWPRGHANMQFTALEANGTKLRAVAANARVDGGQPPHISIAVVIRDENNNDNRLMAKVVYRPDQIAGSLDQLILVLPDGAWHLAHPAQFTRDQHHMTIERFAFANGVRYLTLDASFAPAAAQNVALRARHRSCGAEAADAAGGTNRRRPFRGNFDNRNIDRAIDRGKSEHKWPGDEFPKAGRSEYDDQLQTVNSRTGCDTPSGSKPSA